MKAVLRYIMCLVLIVALTASFVPAQAISIADGGIMLTGLGALLGALTGQAMYSANPAGNNMQTMLRYIFPTTAPIIIDYNDRTDTLVVPVEVYNTAVAALAEYADYAVVNGNLAGYYPAGATRVITGTTHAGTPIRIEAPVDGYYYVDCYNLSPVVLSSTNLRDLVTFRPAQSNFYLHSLTDQWIAPDLYILPVTDGARPDVVTSNGYQLEQSLFVGNFVMQGDMKVWAYSLAKRSNTGYYLDIPQIQIRDGIALPYALPSCPMHWTQVETLTPFYGTYTTAVSSDVTYAGVVGAFDAPAYLTTPVSAAPTYTDDSDIVAVAIDVSGLPDSIPDTNIGDLLGALGQSATDDRLVDVLGGLDVSDLSPLDQVQYDRFLEDANTHTVTDILNGWNNDAEPSANGNIFQRILEWIISIYNAIKDLPALIGSWLSSILDAIRNLLASVGGIAESLWDFLPKILAAIGNLALTAWDFLQDLLDRIGSVAQSVLSIWHYPISWIGTLSASLGLFGGIWSVLPYAMVIPVYASIVIIIVVGLYKRFFT